MDHTGDSKGSHGHFSFFGGNACKLSSIDPEETIMLSKYKRIVLVTRDGDLLINGLQIFIYFARG